MAAMRRRAPGAVDTPPALAKRLVARTLDRLLRGKSAREVLALRVLDPSCGAGQLLVAAYDQLARRAGPRAIECLRGIDIDPVAVAAARAALKARCGDARAAAGAIRCGDALSGRARPRYDAIVGNPPWVEPRRWRRALPRVDVRAYQSAQRGKVDLALPFLERAAQWLRPGGRAGFLIQSRFFKTDYGAGARRLLRGFVSEIEDFGDAALFDGCATYTAMMILSHGAHEVRYRAAGHSVRVKTEDLGDAPWNFGGAELRELDARLAARHGRLGEYAALRICVGVQTLYGRVYRIVDGKNGFGEAVDIERAALRPLCRNRRFTPLRRELADAFVIFPYDGDREIQWSEFAHRFPRAAAYLWARRETIMGAVETPLGEDRWHLYTRPQNLRALARPKVLFPMTVRRVVAAVDERGDVYPDNVNVNALLCERADIDLYALAALFCSRLFDRLARLHAGLAQGGFLKFNRQFAARVPMPLDTLAGPLGGELARAGRARQFDEIDALAERIYGAERARPVLPG
jgi:SAM-dependent methyltransferase